jgi:hypothetical protein
MIEVHEFSRVAAYAFCGDLIREDTRDTTPVTGRKWSQQERRPTGTTRRIGVARPSTQTSIGTQSDLCVSPIANGNPVSFHGAVVREHRLPFPASLEPHRRHVAVAVALKRGTRNRFRSDS